MHDLEQLISDPTHLLPNSLPSRAVSRDFLGALFFEMVIFPYQHCGCLQVQIFRAFKTSDPLKCYSVESNM